MAGPPLSLLIPGPSLPTDRPLVWREDLEGGKRIELVDDLSAIPGIGGGSADISGEGPPAPEIGVDGQYYIDTTSLKYYGPKAGGAWPGGRSISMRELLNAGGSDADEAAAITIESLEHSSVLAIATLLKKDESGNIVGLDPATAAAAREFSAGFLTLLLDPQGESQVEFLESVRVALGLSTGATEGQFYTQGAFGPEAVDLLIAADATRMDLIAGTPGVPVSGATVREARTPFTMTGATGAADLNIVGTCLRAEVDGAFDMGSLDIPETALGAWGSLQLDCTSTTPVLSNAGGVWDFNGADLPTLEALKSTLLTFIVLEADPSPRVLVHSMTEPFTGIVAPVFSGTVPNANAIEDVVMAPVDLGAYFTGLHLTFSLGSGSLPSGVILDSASGLLFGTPGAYGTFSITVTATNTAGSDTSGSFDLIVAEQV